MKTRLILAMLLVALGCLFAGCFTAPNNGDSVCGADYAFVFKGGSPDERSNGPGWDTIIVEAGPTRTGPFQAVAQTKIAFYENATWGAWETAPTVVPRSLWGQANGTREIYLRARWGYTGGNPLYLPTYDNPALGTGRTTQCINDKINAGSDATTAVLACQSHDSPVMRVTAPLVSACGCSNAPVVNGDLVIGDADAFDANRCVSEVKGRLEVARSLTLPDVTFASLTRVGGLTIDYSAAPGSSAPRHVNLPALAAVNGAVTLRGSGVFGAMTSIDVNMPQLTSVTGNIETMFMGGDVRLVGMPNLSALDADASLVFDGVFDGSGFLPQLARIGGKLRIDNSIGMRGVLNALSELGGSLELHYRGAAMRNESIGFAKLANVAGDVILEGTPWSSFPGPDAAFGALTNVGGGLELSGTLLTSAALGAPGLRVGHLSLVANPNLSALPDAAAFSLDSAGDLTVLDNPMLSECAVQAFATAQQDLGWQGVLTMSGNAPCE